jgi:hypothetical protein
MLEGAILIDGHDDAILGVGNQYPMDAVYIYSKRKIIEKFVDNGLTWEQAIELFDSTIAVLDFGDGGPIICDDMNYPLNEDIIDE